MNLNENLLKKCLSTSLEKVNIEEIEKLSYDLIVSREKFYYDENDKYEYNIIPEGWGYWSYNYQDWCSDNKENKEKNENNLSYNKRPLENVQRYFNSHREDYELQLNNSNHTEKINIFSISKKKGNIIKPDPKIFTLDLIKIPKKSKSRIVIKCKFCEKANHLSKDCPMDQVDHDLCIKCLSTKHDYIKCPFMKCLRCNRIGHKTSECSTTNEIVKCTRCRNVGHFALDCLLIPTFLSSSELERVYCILCGEVGHFICPSKGKINIDDIYCDSEDSEKTELGRELKNSKKVNSNFDESVRMSCPNCSGEHLLKECRKNNNKMCLDILRTQNAKSFFKLAPSKLAKDKNFLNDSFSSDSDVEVRNSRLDESHFKEKEVKIQLDAKEFKDNKYFNIKLYIQ